MSLCNKCNGEEAKHEFIGFNVEQYAILPAAGPAIYLDAGKSFLLREREQDLLRVESPEHPYPPPGRLQILKPDALFYNGDSAFLYYLSEHTKRELQFCSRECAISFAKYYSCVLIRLKDSVMILPHQRMMDKYAIRHNVAHHLALMNDESWTSEEAEFRGLLASHPPSPARLVALANKMLADSRYELAGKAADKVLDEYSPVDAVNCAGLLGQLGRFEDIDKAYEAIISIRGTIEALDAEDISGWAILIMAWNYEKATKLSELAVAENPTSVLVVQNHLLLLSIRDRRKAIEFFRAMSSYVRDDAGFFTIGEAFLRERMYVEAEECLRLADLVFEDPLHKIDLAETLYRLARYAEAISVAEDGLKLLTIFIPKNSRDFDGLMRNPASERPKLKKLWRQRLLCIKGKSLQAIGEDEGGRELIQESLDIGGDTDSFFYEGIDRERFITKEKLHRDLLIKEQMIASILEDKKRIGIRAELLKDVLAAFADMERDWHKVHKNPKYREYSDLVDDVYSGDIHVLCMKLRQRDDRFFSQLVEEFSGNFPALFHLNRRIIEMLASAELLIRSHVVDDSVRIFSGPIIELGKALELSVTMLAVVPFQISQSNVGNPLRSVEKRLPSGKTLTVRLFRGEDTKSPASRANLTLSDIEALLSSTEKRWISFCNQHFGESSLWVREALPDTIHQVRNGYRNIAAHYGTMTREQAFEVRNLLKSRRVFETLNAIASTSDLTGAEVR